MPTPLPSRHPSDPSSSGHEWVDHTAEIAVRIHAPTLPALVSEAARAFAELVPKHLEGSECEGSRTFHLTGRDATATLVDWLNELVYLAEAESWVPTRITAEWEAEVESEGRGAPSGDPGIRVVARGRALERPFVLVKAATLHGADVREGPDHMEAEITLDI